MIDARATAVLQYWFGTPDHPDWGSIRKMWFGGGPQVDAEIHAQFGALHSLAAQGALDAWREDAQSCLALVVVLDQFSRTVFRGSADAFASDPKALELARAAIASGFDTAVMPVQRWFFYLPFEHSESLADQDRAVELFAALPDDPTRQMGLDYARKHRDVIVEFGRFPHRNRALGRVSTPAEEAWLAAGGGFG
jgi:uncharacterized protein (DUF924 family)